MAARRTTFAQTFMVSSTMNDLYDERMAAFSAVQATGHVAWSSEKPPWAPTAGEDSLSMDMAARCDYFILILGPRYGYTPQGRFASNEQSITELEYFAARSSYRGRGKIVVCLQNAAVDTPNERQWRFIQEVLEQDASRDVLRFETVDDLRRKLQAHIRRLVFYVYMGSNRLGSLVPADINAYVRELQLSLEPPAGPVELGLRTTLSAPSPIHAHEIGQSDSSDFIRGSLSDFLVRFKHIVVIDDPGTGKTTLLKIFAKTAVDRFLASSSLMRARGPHVNQQRVPIFLRAQDLSRILQSSGLDDAKAVALAAGASSENSIKAVEALVSQGQAILLVDGFDELATSGEGRVLEHALSGLRENEIVISTRPTADSRFWNPLIWHACQMQQLDAVQRHDLVRHLVSAYQPVETVERIAQQFEDALASSYELSVLTGNPVTLNLMVEWFLHTGQLPSEQADIFRLMFNVTGQRESQKELVFKEVMAQLALEMVAKESQVFTYIEALETGRSLLASPGEQESEQLEDLFDRSPFLRRVPGDSWSFVSLWTQEYFAALALADMPPSARETLLRRQTLLVRWKGVLTLLISELRSRGLLVDAENISRLMLELKPESSQIVEATPVLPWTALTRLPKVFISHSSLDNTFAKQLVADLEHRGVRVWVDYNEITDGIFLERIDAGLSLSDWLILILSAHALASRYVMMEFYAGLTRERKGKMRGIILVVGGEFEEGSVPPSMDSLHRWDGLLDYGVAFRGICRALGVDVE